MCHSGQRQEGMPLASLSIPASVIWELQGSHGAATRWKSLATVGVWHDGEMQTLTVLRHCPANVNFPDEYNHQFPLLNYVQRVILSKVQSGASLGKPQSPRVRQQMVHSPLPHSSLNTDNEVLQLWNGTSHSPTTWLDLETWLCLTAAGVDSVILLGTWKERKSRCGWALEVSPSTVLVPPS